MENNIIFKNKVGVIYTDKIVFESYENNNIQLDINDIAHVRIIKIKNTKLNLLFFSIAACLFLTSFFAGGVINNFKISFYIFSALFFFTTIFYENSTYMIQVILCIAKQKKIKFNKKELNEASTFLKKFTEYRESNPEFFVLK